MRLGGRGGGTFGSMLFAIFLVGWSHASSLSPPSIDTSVGDPRVATPDAFKCEVCMIVMERKEANLDIAPCAGLEFYGSVVSKVLPP